MSEQRYRHGGNIWDKPDPLGWLDFSANINPWGPPPALLAAIQRALPAINRYPDPQARAATTAVATYLQVPPENVLLTNGGLSGLELLISYLRPCAASICQPTFVEYERLCRLYGITVTNLPCLQQRRQFRLPLAALSALPSQSLVFLCNPVNPTGSLSNPVEIAHLQQLLRPSGSRLILDEAFIDFAPAAASARQLALSDPELLIAGSLTKIFAIPGLRLGYLVANAHLIAALRQRQTPWSLNLLAQVAAETLPCLTGFVQASRCHIGQARAELVAALQQLGIGVLPSQANFLLLDLQEWGLTAQELNQRLYAKRIQIRDCSNFVGLDGYYGRIAVSKPEDNHRLVQALEEIKCGM